MAIKITTINEDRIRVRNKIVYRDMNNNWVAVTELTTGETAALNNHLSQLNNEGP